MEILDTKNAYKVPRVKVVDVNGQGVLCGSLDGSPSTNDYNRGSDSYIGLGNDDD